MLKKLGLCFNLIIVIFLAFVIRIYGINWDQGFHLHPDERMLIMVADRIHFFNQLNPDFFNYGSLPIYILKGSAQLLDYLFKTSYANYDGMLRLGRYISVLTDLLVIILIYKITILLFKQKNIALLSSFFYSIAFFPIQNTHFFVVDVFLNLFSTLLIYKLLQFLYKPSVKIIFFLGIIYSAMLTTKSTPIIFLPLILIIFIYKALAMKQWNNVAIYLFIFCSTLLTFSFLFMPYAFFEHTRFINDVLAQIRMNSDPYIFPYTLQYVGTTPYLYYLKNIYLWGLGPIISIISLLGFVYIVRNFLSYKLQVTSYKKFALLIFFFLFYLFYFLVIGRSAVKFMRYMLLLYPLFAILAGYGADKISNSQFLIFKKKLRIIYILILVSLLWTFMFTNIYSQKHTRIAATEWINKNIPPYSSVATEHWDDGMPLTGGERFNRIELPLYERPDDDNKWNNIINPRLQQADYIIIASNRLYVPLQKLFDCKKYRSCYPKTTEYYKKLFSNQLGFKKVAEFSAYPKLEIACPVKFCKNFFGGNWKLEIRDDVADESFTVYDHPKIIIFKRYIQ